MPYTPLEWVENNIHLTPENLDKDNTAVKKEFESIDLTFDLLADKDVIAAQPSVKCKINPNSPIEVGTDATPCITVTFDQGLYRYNESGVKTNKEPTNVKITSVKLADNLNESYTFTTTTTGDYVFNFENFRVTDGLTRKYTCTVEHGPGSTAFNNIARTSSVKIESGTITSNVNISSCRKFFYKTFTENTNFTGSKYEENPDNVRNLTSGNATGTSFTIAVPAGTKSIVIAMPSTKTIQKITDANAAGMQDWYNAGTTTKNTISVSGATLGENKLDYELVIINDTTSSGLQSNTFTVTYK